jgi:hypothetical protein
MKNSVSIGLGTIVGYGLTIIGGAVTAWAAAEPHPSISVGLLAALTYGAAQLTTLGRMYQAGQAPAPVAGQSAAALPQGEEETVA